MTLPEKMMHGMEEQQAVCLVKMESIITSFFQKKILLIKDLFNYYDNLQFSLTILKPST